jgi:hypothetical protein
MFLQESNDEKHQLPYVLGYFNSSLPRDPAKAYTRTPHLLTGLYNCISRLRFALSKIRGQYSDSFCGFTEYSCPQRTQSVQVCLQGSESGEYVFATKATTEIY